MKLKKLLSLALALCIVLGAGSAFAMNEGDARAVIGANLSEENKNQVYSTFGISRGSVTELTVTNAEERQYLEGLVSSDIIGSRSISCVYVEIAKAGSGLDVSVSNVNWCTRETYMNALVTAGTSDAKVIVTAPFTVTGTAALTGIYKAYESITGTALDDVAKLVGTQELVITNELADEIGSYDASMIVNELKKILDETKNMTDAEVDAEIRRIAKEYNVSISDFQISQLITLCRSLEGLDSSALKEKVEAAQDAIKKLAGVQETANKFVEGVKNIFQSIGNFFSNLFGKKN